MALSVISVHLYGRYIVFNIIDLLSHIWYYNVIVIIYKEYMQVKLNTDLVPFFSGTYNTIFDLSHKYDNDDYDIDHNEYMDNILEAYKSMDIFKNIDFVKKVEFIGWYSPKFYNYGNDELDFVVDIDKKELLKTLNNLNNKEFKDFLKNNYSSYSGFVSFTSNDYKELYDKAIMGDEQSIGAILTYLLKDELEHIEYSVYERV